MSQILHFISTLLNARDHIGSLDFNMTAKKKTKYLKRFSQQTTAGVVGDRSRRLWNSQWAVLSDHLLQTMPHSCVFEHWFQVDDKSVFASLEVETSSVFGWVTDWDSEFLFQFESEFVLLRRWQASWLRARRRLCPYPQWHPQDELPGFLFKPGWILFLVPFDFLFGFDFHFGFAFFGFGFHPGMFWRSADLNNEKSTE